MAVNTVNKATEKHQASSFQFLTCQKVGSEFQTVELGPHNYVVLNKHSSVEP